MHTAQTSDGWLIDTTCSFPTPSSRDGTGGINQPSDVCGIQCTRKSSCMTARKSSCMTARGAPSAAQSVLLYLEGEGAPVNPAARGEGEKGYPSQACSWGRGWIEKGAYISQACSQERGGREYPRSCPEVRPLPSPSLLPPVYKQTENITFPHTSYAGSNKNIKIDVACFGKRACAVIEEKNQTWLITMTFRIQCLSWYKSLKRCFCHIHTVFRYSGTINKKKPTCLI